MTKLRLLWASIVYIVLDNVGWLLLCVLLVALSMLVFFGG